MVLLPTFVALLLLPVAGGGTAGATTSSDTAAPNTYVRSFPGSPTNKTTARFAFSSTELGGIRFECAMAGGAFEPCESPKSYENLAEGRHGFKVRSIDAAGNDDPTPASRSWTVDLTPPRTLLTGGEERETTNTAARFEFSADEPVYGFYCSLDGAAPSRCASPKEYSGLSVGEHVFRVQARDRAGNYDPTPEATVWTVVEDRAPAVTIEGAPRIESYYEYHHFGFSADVPGSSFYCSLDEEPFVPCASGGYRHVPYGVHTFGVYAVSPGGARGGTSTAEYESRDPGWD